MCKGTQSGIHSCDNMSLLFYNSLYFLICMLYGIRIYCQKGSRRWQKWQLKLLLSSHSYSASRSKCSLGRSDYNGKMIIQNMFRETLKIQSSHFITYCYLLNCLRGRWFCDRHIHTNFSFNIPLHLQQPMMCLLHIVIIYTGLGKD